MEVLSYLMLAVPFVLAILLGLLLPLVVLKSYRSAGFGMGVVAFLFLANATFLEGGAINVGIRLYPMDVVSLLLGLVALARWVVLPECRPGLASWYLFVFSVLLSLGLGLATLGTAAGVSARPYFYAVVTASYVLTFPADAKLVRQLLTTLAWVGVYLVLLVIARWIITFVPIADLLPPGGRFASSDASQLRVVGSGEALLLAQFTLIALFYAMLAPSLRWLRPLLPVVLLFVVVLQHRSVWLALLAAVLARFVLPQAGRKASVQLLATLLIVVTASIPLAFSGKLSGAFSDVARSADRAVGLNDTAHARLETWRFMLKTWANGGPRSWAIGQPMGTSTERLLLGDSGNYARVEFQAHNYYIQTLFNTGLVGLAATLAVYLAVGLALLRGVHDAELGASAGAMLLLLTAQVVYYLPYGIDYMQGLVLGTAGALALVLRQRRRATLQAQALPVAARPLNAGRPRIA